MMKEEDKVGDVPKAHALRGHAGYLHWIVLSKSSGGVTLSSTRLFPNSDGLIQDPLH